MLSSAAKHVGFLEELGKCLSSDDRLMGMMQLDMVIHPKIRVDGKEE